MVESVIGVLDCNSAAIASLRFSSTSARSSSFSVPLAKTLLAGTSSPCILVHSDSDFVETPSVVSILLQVCSADGVKLNHHGSVSAPLSPLLRSSPSSCLSGSSICLGLPRSRSRCLPRLLHLASFTILPVNFIVDFILIIQVKALTFCF